MDNDSGRSPKRGMSLPFFLSLLLFGGVVADHYSSGPDFLVSAGYRQQPLFAAGVVIVALLLWLWVLAAARRRSERFDGPIQTVRGTNGAVQPLLATMFLVTAANLGYGHAVPKWLNVIVAGDYATMSFALADAPAAPRRGCSPARAANPGFGEVELCLPAALAGARPGEVVAVSGTYSFFGMAPETYVMRDDQLIEPRLTVEPATSSPTAEGIIEDLIEPTPVPEADAGDKTGKARKN